MNNILPDAAMVNSKFSDAHCKLQTFQKDVRLSVNMSDSVDQPLHVGSAVNEVSDQGRRKLYQEVRERNTCTNM